MQFLKVDMLNKLSEFEFKAGDSDFAIEYEIPAGVPKHGTCAPDCDAEGFALWNDNKECKLCEPFGCSM